LTDAIEICDELLKEPMSRNGQDGFMMMNPNFLDVFNSEPAGLMFAALTQLLFFLPTSMCS
jgi:hypothetical protein